jgi:hypothetical protein
MTPAEDGHSDLDGALYSACTAEVRHAIEQYRDDKLIVGAESDALFLVARQAAVRAARESIAATVSTWLAGHEFPQE